MKKNTKILVDCSKAREHEISPYLFSHFVEDIRDFMDGMLAFTLKDMDFEEEDTVYRGVSGCWYPVTDGKCTKYALEPAAYLHSGHSQKISMVSADQAYSGIAQKISVKEKVDYFIKVYARSSPDVNYLSIEIFDKNTNSKLTGTEIELSSHDWKTYTCSLSVPTNCSNAEVRVGVDSARYPWRDSVSTGMLWLDHISMLPSDHIAYVKKEVFKYIKDLNPKMLRFGGNVISAYHWKYGVGPFYLRPNMYNEAWGGMCNKYFGTDEFIMLCRELDVEPMICVNAGSGTPQEAAEWIQYCNGSIDTPMGALRASNGHTKPYGVKYWQIGNEIFGEWQVGHCTATEYAEGCVEFSKAMKQADPDILLIGCGDTVPEWNSTLLNLAGKCIDYLAIHIYHSYGRLNMENDIDDEDKFRAIVSFPEVRRNILEATDKIIGSDPELSHIRYAITEYNLMYLHNTVRKSLPDEHTLEAGVAIAANLNEFIRNSNMVAITNFSDLVNGWLGGCIRVGDSYSDQSRGKIPGWSSKGNIVYGTPAYYVLKMYSDRNIAYVVETNTECDKYSVKVKDNSIDLSKLPVLDTVACLNKEKNILTLFAVNRGLKDLDVDISLNKLKTEKEINMWELTGNHYRETNDALNTEKIVCKTGRTKGTNFTLKAHSVYIFEFKIC